MSEDRVDKQWERILEFFEKIGGKQTEKVIGINVEIKEKDRFTEEEGNKVLKIKRRENDIVIQINNVKEHEIVMIRETPKQIEMTDEIGIKYLITNNREKRGISISIISNTIQDYEVEVIELIYEYKDLGDVIVHDNVQIWYKVFMDEPILRDEEETFRERSQSRHRRQSDYSYSFVEDDEGSFISYEDDDNKPLK